MIVDLLRNDLSRCCRTGGVLHFYAGGGIVADSQGEDEYQETLSKVSSWFSLIQRHPMAAAG